MHCILFVGQLQSLTIAGFRIKSGLRVSKMESEELLLMLEAAHSSALQKEIV